MAENVVIDKGSNQTLAQCQVAANTATNKAAETVTVIATATEQATIATTAADAASQAAQSTADIRFATCALMRADLAHDAEIAALVYADQHIAGYNTYTISTNVVANDTVLFGGITFTAVTIGAEGNEFNVGTTATESAANLATAINANTILNNQFTATYNANVITIIDTALNGGNTPSTMVVTGGTGVITAGTATESTSNGIWIKQGISGSGSWQKSLYNQTVDINEKLKEVTPPLTTITKINAITDRYSNNSELSSKHGDTSTVHDATFTHVWNSEAWTKYGVQTAIRVSETVNNVSKKYRPRVCFVVTPDDLTGIGVTPDDTTPPKISLGIGLLKSSFVNISKSNLQVFFCVRYGGILDASYKTSYDVVFNTANATPMYLGASDTTTFASVIGSAYDDGSMWGATMSNIPIPATYKDLAFTGIVICILGYSSSTTDADCSYDVVKVGVVKGSSIDIAKSIDNPDDQVKGIRSKDLLPETITDVAGQAAEQMLVQSTNIITQKLKESGKKVINIKSADKIAIMGDSYSASHFTVQDKAYISNLSALSEYNWENFSRAGDDLMEIRDRTVNNTPEYHDTLGIKDYGAKYTIITSYTNDWYQRRTNLDYYYENLKDLIETVRALGIEPIVATEFYSDYGYDTIGLKQVAEDYGCRFIDIASKSRIFDRTRYAGFWGSEHPGTRTNGVMYDPILRFLSTFPRPRQTLKIFRVRPTVTFSDINELIVDTIPQRAEKWKEISVGHHALNDTEAPYYDKLDTVTDFTYQKVISEYLKLQNNETVSLGEYSLVEIIVPSTARDVTEFALYLSDPTVTVYGKHMFYSPEITATKYQAFAYVDDPTIVVGDIYTANTLGTTQYTVVQKLASEGIILCTPANTQVLDTPGTLTRVSGTGDTSISYSRSCTGYDPDWYAKYGKAEGKWTQITGTDGVYTIAQADMKNYCQYDKFSFLLYKSGGVSLTDIYATWEGAENKSCYTKPNISDSKNTELLVQTKMGKESEISGWTITGTIVPYVPADSSLPYGCVGCSDVTTVNKVTQTLPATFEYELTQDLQIKIWARNFPTIFDPSVGTYPTDAPINSNTFDFATLVVELAFTNATYPIKIEKLVGLNWQEVLISLHLPTILSSKTTAYMTNPVTVTLYSKDKDIQVAKVSAKLV